MGTLTMSLFTFSRPNLLFGIMMMMMVMMMMMMMVMMMMMRMKMRMMMICSWGEVGWGGV